jgi:hypothetical protein
MIKKLADYQTTDNKAHAKEKFKPKLCILKKNFTG